MKRPDIRQRVIEAVLDSPPRPASTTSQLIAALALHRRMTEDELRHAVGDRVYDAFAPHGLLYNHDAEDPDGLGFLGTTPQGEEVEINKRAAESDLLVYVNINLVVDGRRLEVRPPPAWPATRACATTTTCAPCSTASRSWTSTAPSCTRRTGAWARCIATHGRRRSSRSRPRSTTTRFGRSGPMAVLQKREWEWIAARPGHASCAPAGRARPHAAPDARRADLPGILAPPHQ